MFIRIFRIYLKTVVTVMLIAAASIWHLAIAPINILISAGTSLYASIRYRDESKDDTEDVIVMIRDGRREEYSEALKTAMEWIYK